MEMTNNIYVVARQIYSNENLTVLERSEQLAAAITQMVQGGVASKKDLDEYLEQFKAKTFYDDQGRFCTRVRHPNREVIVINYLKLNTQEGKIGEIQYSEPRGTTRYFEITEETMSAAFELIAGMDRLTDQEKRFLSNALVQII